jgi:hypothetical protein
VKHIRNVDQEVDSDKTAQYALGSRLGKCVVKGDKHPFKLEGPVTVGMSRVEGGVAGAERFMDEPMVALAAFGAVTDGPAFGASLGCSGLERAAACR